MVIAKFVDGTEETYEIKREGGEPWKYDTIEQCYKIKIVTGVVVLPVGFIKSLEYFEPED